jgi:hypothetical protein
MKERYIEATPQAAIRRHIEAAEDWEWHAIASTLYVWTDRLNDRFFEREMPDAVLGFERMDHRILAGYTLKRNAQGLLYEIAFNTHHLERPLWETLETLMHEYVHLWQQNYGQDPVARNYHNVEFVQRCEAIGLHPAIGSGVHLRPADGAFAEFLKAYGVPEPEAVEGVKLNPTGKPLDWWTDPRERPKGRSTLHKWSCGCQSVRVGTKEFHAQCLKCGNEFRRVNGQHGAQPGQAEDLPVQDSGWSQGILGLAEEDGMPADPEASPIRPSTDALPDDEGPQASDPPILPAAC